jgi:hypothetical protein
VKNEVVCRTQHSGEAIGLVYRSDSDVHVGASGSDPEWQRAMADILEGASGRNLGQLMAKGGILEAGSGHNLAVVRELQ